MRTNRGRNDDVETLLLWKDDRERPAGGQQQQPAGGESAPGRVALVISGDLALIIVPHIVDSIIYDRPNE